VDFSDLEMARGSDDINGCLHNLLVYVEIKMDIMIYDIIMCDCF